MIRFPTSALFALSFAVPSAFAHAAHVQEDALAQEDAEVPSEPVEEAPPPVEIFSVRWGGIGALLTSPKDRGLLRALRMLDDRVVELPAEFGEAEEIPPDLLPLLAAAFEGRTELSVGFAEPTPSSPLPFFARFELEGAETGPSPAALLERLFASTGLELGPADADGRVALPLPVPAWYRDVGGKLEVGVGSEGAIDRGEAFVQLPAGAVEALRMRIDYAAFVEHALPLLEEQGADVAALRPLLDATGFSSLTIESATGGDATQSFTTTISRGLGDTAAAEMLADAPIPASALALVPADAEWACVGAYDLREIAAFYRDLIETMSSYSSDDAEALEILAFLDDLAENFLRHVGGVQGMYASDTTGGGGLSSAVLFASLSDPGAFSAALDERLASLEELGRTAARGYVRLRREDTEGGRFTSLVFAGLPVPFEPTYAIAGGYLFVGLSAQSVRAAVAHALSGAAGLTANPRFAAQVGAVPPDLHVLGFLDTPRFLRDGYSIASRAATALESFVRSPSDEERDAGAVMPPFAEFQEGALAMVCTVRLRGGDLVQQWRTDGSKLVNATAIMGCMGDLYTLAILGGMASGMSQKQQKAAASDGDAILAQAEVVSIESALALYALDHGGEYPTRLDELATPDASGNTYLVELPLDPWGNPYQYKAPKRRGKEPRVTSLGKDGVRGGRGPGRDIGADTVLSQPKAGPKTFLEKLFE